jgi:ammonia channel protein AmtB
MVSLALAALVVLFLAWLIFSPGGAATAQTGGGYALTKSVISSGGGGLAGGSYTLAGVIGQPDAGALTGGSYTLGGGFWGGAGDRHNIYLPLVVRNS